MFAERRRRFLEAMGPDAVAVILGARLAMRSADTHFPFRQDSDFWYLTGFN
ncbi:MAG TPA: aminopeptidase P N-terminal domain-containing protein, partial [Myxococcota bacterium]|nr:aminopeptidase P N-terminal domain-containing protein [Myxococcota bacterium]